MSTPDYHNEFFKLTAQFEPTDDPDIDPGIAAFEDTMRHAEQQIIIENAVGTVLEADLLAGLNDQWPYGQHRLPVKGRLYFIGNPANIPAHGSWSEPIIDETGKYCIVDTKLVSDSIATVERTDGSVRVAYIFRDINPDNDISLIGYPEHISMEYPFPTAAGIDKQLHERWPELLARIEAVIEACKGDYTAALRGLEALSSELSPACHDSEEFPVWLGQYVYNKLGFKNEGIVGLELLGRARVVNQEDEVFDPENGLVPCILETPTRAYGDVAAMFVAINQGESKDQMKFGAYLNLRSQSPVAVDGHEVVMCATESIQSIWSTRLQASIGATATIDALHGRPPELGDISSGFGNDAEAIEIRRTDEREIRRLEKLTELIADFVMETQAAQRLLPTVEVAQTVSLRLARDFQHRLELSGIEPQDVFEVAGVGVVKANLLMGQSRDQPDLRLGLSEDPEKRITRLTAGESMRGTLAGFFGGYQHVVDETGETRGYCPVPKLLLRTRRDEHDLSGGQGMLPVTIEQRAHVDLDGDAGISLPALQLRKDRMAAIEVMHEQHANHPVRELLDTVIQELQTDAAVEPQDLTTLEQLKEAASIIDASSKDLSAAVEVLRRTFIEHHLKVIGSYLHDNGYVEDGYAEGRVIDVIEKACSEGGNPTVSFAIEHVHRAEGAIKTDMYYIPIAKIQACVY